MRMRELVAATGVSRTTIHHYLREGLLPEPRKTAANAAVYSDEHVRRLRLIRSLRTGALGPLPLAGVRAVLELVDAGLEPDLAVALRSRPGASGASTSGRGRAGQLSASDVAREAGMAMSTVRQLIEHRLLVGKAAGGRPGTVRFDLGDAEIAGLYGALMESTGLSAPDLGPVRDLVAEIVRYESVLADVATAGQDEEQRQRTRLEMTGSWPAIHAYLFARLRATVPPHARNDTDSFA